MVGSTPRRRGLLRRGHAHLSEPGDSGDGISGPPRQAYDCPRLVFVACLGSVSWLGL